MAEYPSYANSRKNGSWIIEPPSFVKKDRQRITWRSAVQIEATALQDESSKYSQYARLVTDIYNRDRVAQVGGGPAYLGSFDWAKPVSNPIPDEAFRAAGFQTLVPESRIVAKGRTTFHVEWSTTITAHRHFVKPKVDSVEFIESVWE